MDKKIKLVFVIYSEYSQLWEDYYCVSELLDKFDIEYWDCSDFVDYGLHVKNRIDRPYVHKIKTFDEFKQRLKELPKDTLINIDVFKTLKNYHFFKTLSLYFKHIIFVDLHTNDTIFGSIDNKHIANRQETTLSKIRNFLYGSDFCKLLIKIMVHPSRYKTFWRNYVQEKEEQLFFIHFIKADPSWKMHINHPDVNKAFFQKTSLNNNEYGKYIVYVDENFPYHPEIEKQHPGLNVNALAPSHFRALNRFFQYVEKKYKCPVIIAAHPSADYSTNPFEGRKVIYQQTESLVANSIATCLHSSTAVSYAMVYNKPILVLIDDAIRQVEKRCIATENTIKNCGGRFVDLEDEHYDAQFDLLPDEIRKAYLQKYFGDADLNPQVSNADLYAEYYVQLYNQIYGK